MATYSMFRGDYRELDATVSDSYNAGSRLLFAVKATDQVDPVNATDSNAIFTVDMTGDQAVDNGDGTITFTIIVSPEKTSNSLPGDFEAQIRYIDSAGHPTSYEPFDFTIEGDLNQRS